MSDGNEIGPLLQGTDGNLYGLANTGGSQSVGTVFEVSTNGVLQNFVSLTTTTGDAPSSSLIQAQDGALYGVAALNGGGSGTVFRVEVGQAPVVGPLSPSNGLVFQYVGLSETLTISATGPGPLSFQWFRNGQFVSDDFHISGSTTSNLTISPVFASDFGDYSAYAINALGENLSGNYSFSVYPPALATLTNNGGGSFGFPAIHFTGTSNMNYHVWASPDLINWMPLGLATQTQPGIYNFVDTAATNYPTRFYQLRVP